MDVERRRGVDRPRTDVDGCDARHGFSFGAHYDPANTFFGALLAHNDERIAPGAGYPAHTHREADLLTWVVSGALRHTDSLGTARTVRPGEVQVLAAGTGVEHAELCTGPEPVRFVQAWLVPDALDPPAVHSRDVVAELATGRPVLVAAGARIGEGAEPRSAPAATTDPLPLRRADAALWAAHLAPGASWTLPQARFRHVYAVRGGAHTPAGELAEGDELRITGEGRAELTAGADGAEVLVWAMGSDLRPT